MCIRVYTIVIIHRFHIYKSTYSLKFICNTEMTSQGTFTVTCKQAQSGETSETPTHTFPDKIEQDDTLPFVFPLIL